MALRAPWRCAAGSRGCLLPAWHRLHSDSAALPPPPAASSGGALFALGVRYRRSELVHRGLCDLLERGEHRELLDLYDSVASPSAGGGPPLPLPLLERTHVLALESLYRTNQSSRFQRLFDELYPSPRVAPPFVCRLYARRLSAHQLSASDARRVFEEFLPAHGQSLDFLADISHLLVRYPGSRPLTEAILLRRPSLPSRLLFYLLRAALNAEDFNLFHRIWFSHIESLVLSPSVSSRSSASASPSSTPSAAVSPATTPLPSPPPPTPTPTPPLLSSPESSVPVSPIEPGVSTTLYITGCVQDRQYGIAWSLLQRLCCQGAVHTSDLPPLRQVEQFFGTDALSSACAPSLFAKVREISTSESLLPLLPLCTDRFDCTEIVQRILSLPSLSPMAAGDVLLASRHAPNLEEIVAQLQHKVRLVGTELVRPLIQLDRRGRFDEMLELYERVSSACASFRNTSCESELLRAYEARAPERLEELQRRILRGDIISHLCPLFCFSREVGVQRACLRKIVRSLERYRFFYFHDEDFLPFLERLSSQQQSVDAEMRALVSVLSRFNRNDFHSLRVLSEVDAASRRLRDAFPDRPSVPRLLAPLGSLLAWAGRQREIFDEANANPALVYSPRFLSLYRARAPPAPV